MHLVTLGDFNIIFKNLIEPIFVGYTSEVPV